MSQCLNITMLEIENSSLYMGQAASLLDSVLRDDDCLSYVTRKKLENLSKSMKEIHKSEKIRKDMAVKCAINYSKHQIN